MISAVHVGGEVAPELPNLPRVPWMRKGRCRKENPELFYVDGEGKAAKAICAQCRVASECLLWALSNDEQFGIWGGSTAKERQIMKRYM